MCPHLTPRRCCCLQPRRAWPWAAVVVMVAVMVVVAIMVAVAVTAGRTTVVLVAVMVSVAVVVMVTVVVTVAVTVMVAAVVAVAAVMVYQVEGKAQISDTSPDSLPRHSRLRHGAGSAIPIPRHSTAQHRPHWGSRSSCRAKAVSRA